MLNFILKKIFGTQNERTLKRLQPVVDEINSLEPTVSGLSDDALKAKTQEFRKRLAAGETKDQLLCEAFAVVREVGKRVLKMRHFDVQLMGGVVLHQGKIAEMATGEGKTLVATLPVYLNALTGEGVHVVTVNDYLARRDREWMGPVYEFLGLTVGVIQHGMDAAERQAAYNSDVTYGTNNEFGFDFLRDNMEFSAESKRQRELSYAIVDEVDSILIDEARTPLIISGPAEESTDKYYKIDKIIPSLKKEDDYTVDEKANTATLTEDGVKHCEKLLGLENLYENTQVDIIHHINQALKAHVLFRRDVDYVIKEGKVVIVDQFTGRLMPGRRFSDGLHQALEAKENVKIERENQTLATITFQNYFRMYGKLAGMTGTAATEAVEFEKIYKLDVVVIPTNKPLRRENCADCIYKTEREKFNAVADEIAEMHRAGRPVLVGTISIDKSEHVSRLLGKRNLPHAVLNAKNHEKEAEIVARAGQPAAITISTNMAGRGTDIVLGEGVASLGGLHVVGTERHEARRIDNQLRGRSGRQGDPGSSKFFLSLEDDLMRIFGSDRISGLMDRLGMEEGQEIQHPLVTRAIERAQKRVETRNFDIRKHLLEYDNVMNRQREIIYAERRKILEAADLKDHVLDMISDALDDFSAAYLSQEVREDERDPKKFFEVVSRKFLLDLAPLKTETPDPESLKEKIMEMLERRYDEKEKSLTKETMHYLNKSVLLQVIDGKWKEHLHSLDNLREGIYLRAYGQRDPLIEYKHEAFDLFERMISTVKTEAIELIFKIQVVHERKLTSVMAESGREELHPDAQVLGGAEKAAPRTAPSPATGPEMPPAPRPARPGGGGQKPGPVKRTHKKIGRNDPCPCGSGKKYKKCCGRNA